MIRGVTKRPLHCILKPCLETNLLYLLLPKQLDPPTPSSLPAKNYNCLLLIITIPGRRWIACREEASDTSHRRLCWASLKTSALRLRRMSV
jgi:BarA-like signal transduction histidine kinase